MEFKTTFLNIFQSPIAAFTHQMFDADTPA